MKDWFKNVSIGTQVFDLAETIVGFEGYQPLSNVLSSALSRCARPQSGTVFQLRSERGQRDREMVIATDEWQGHCLSIAFFLTI
jgi:hypothetical protein